MRWRVGVWLQKSESFTLAISGLLSQAELLCRVKRTDFQSMWEQMGLVVLNNYIPPPKAQY